MSRTWRDNPKKNPEARRPRPTRGFGAHGSYETHVHRKHKKQPSVDVILFHTTDIKHLSNSKYHPHQGVQEAERRFDIMNREVSV